MASTERVPCPICKGKGRVIVRSELVVKGKARPMPPLELSCATCRGECLITPKDAAEIKFSLTRWCHCEVQGDPIYHPDTRKMKHHWTCSNCGKIVQIG